MMRPNFALDLSSRGIALLRRAGEERRQEDDWQTVGEVALDAPDFRRALAALREAAGGRAPEGLRTEIILPDDQIRYLDLPVASVRDGDHTAAVARALDGVTPYALAELSWDWSVTGETVQVAAVALETLDEAGSFAREHGFNPVRFVARPGADRFDGTPCFATAAGAEAASAEDTAESEASLSFSRMRAERGARAATAPRLDGATRLTPARLPEDEAREISGAAMASLAPREGATDAADDTGPRASTAEDPAQGQTEAPPPAPDPRPQGITKADEAERLTIFGARSEQRAQRDGPRVLGRALTSAVLVSVIGVASWAAFFPESEIGRLLRGAAPQVAVTPEIPELSSADPGSDAPEAATADPELTESVAAPDERATAPPVGTSGRDRPLPIVSWTPPRTPEEERARYAETGIWPVAPEPPAEPRTGSLDNFYQTSIDGDVTIGDAVALDMPEDRVGGTIPARPALPPPADRTFDLDARGLVRATPDGALTPEGVRVFAGPPPVRQPDAPVRTVPLPGLSLTEEAAEALESLSGTRPRLRPAALVEGHERGALGGRTRTEIAMLRPRDRPAAVAEIVTPRAPASAAIDAAVAEAAEEAAEEAIARSLKPRLRPEAVTRTARAAAPAQTRTTASVAPQIPTSASVARRATERNAINLRQVNLIGVYGTRADRRALVRLANGRYRKVQVGDRIDGGQISAIGNDELRYIKRGRSVVLRMPQG